MPRAIRSRPPRAGTARAMWAEETLRAIRAGEVDAFVMGDSDRRRTIELRGDPRPYRVLIERMNEGALTLAGNGTILYCNQRFAELVRAKRDRVLGSRLQDLVPQADRGSLDALLVRARQSGVVGEFVLRRDGRSVPVTLSLGPAGNVGSRTRIVGVVTDVSERHRVARLRMSLQRRLLVAADEERRALARELHDETGQSLTALLVRLRGLEESPTLEMARQAALELRELTARALEDVGRLARGLHPRVLDEFGLAMAVERQAQEFERTHGIAVTLRKTGFDDRDLPPHINTTVYRLLQEALTNVARHAHAGRVRIHLDASTTGVTLELRDDGRGVDPAVALRGPQAGRPGHLGLVGMRERTALFGGTLEIRSKPGVGTTVIAHLPLTEPRGRRTSPQRRAPRNGKSGARA